jgi:hypothetical protein
MTLALQSTQLCKVYYYHHLTDYYVNVAKEGTAAVTWAGAHLRLRENFATQSTLAWARGWIDRALASGVVDAHLLFRAAKIYGESGDRDFLQRAKKLNPFVERFHLHH